MATQYGFPHLMEKKLWLLLLSILGSQVITIIEKFNLIEVTFIYKYAPFPMPDEN